MSHKGAEETDRPVENLLRPSAIVVDYDRTLTDDALTPFEPALSVLRDIQRKHVSMVIIATGRNTSYVRGRRDVFGFADSVVCENGATVWMPSSDRIERLADGNMTKAAFARSPLEYAEGEVVVSLNREHERDARRVLDLTHIDAEISYNQDSIMVLPRGVDKASGVLAALRILGVPSEDLICIGDGENDLSLFKIARLKVATEGSAMVLKRNSDVVCKGSCAIGVTRFLQELLRTVRVDAATGSAP